MGSGGYSSPTTARNDGWHARCSRSIEVLSVMTLLNNPAFWDKKFRIAILTLATFIALC
jgi:hypothetical protein